LAKVTLVFAVLLVALGLIGYVGTGSQHMTALIPTWFGIALALFGLLAMSPSEALQGYLHARSGGLEPDHIAISAQVAMAGLLLIYVILCVRSFIAARRSGKV
jgi:hypothetical protein